MIAGSIIHLVFQKDKGENFETRFNAQKLERKMKGKINKGESCMIRKGKS